jgi:hypothetical protein
MSGTIVWRILKSMLNQGNQLFLTIDYRPAEVVLPVMMNPWLPCCLYSHKLCPDLFLFFF